MARTREEISREIAGYLLGIVGFLVLLAVLTYHPLDPSLFAAGSDIVRNLLSYGGAAIAGILVGLFGFPALAVPAMMMAVGWHWLRALGSSRRASRGSPGRSRSSAGTDFLRLWSDARRTGVASSSGAARSGAWSPAASTSRWAGCRARAVRRGAPCGRRLRVSRLAAARVLGRSASWSPASAPRWRRAGRAGARIAGAGRCAAQLLRRHQERHPGAPLPPLVVRERLGDARFRIRRLRQRDDVGGAGAESGRVGGAAGADGAAGAPRGTGAAAAARGAARRTDGGPGEVRFPGGADLAAAREDHAAPGAAGPRTRSQTALRDARARRGQVPGVPRGRQGGGRAARARSSPPTSSVPRPA